MSYSKIILGVLWGIFASASWSAEVPNRMNYQGRIVQSNTLVNGSRNLTFQLFDDSSGGRLLLKETDTLNLVDGLYATSLGDNPDPADPPSGPQYDSLKSALQDAGTNAYLQISVNGNVLSPREPLRSVAYALIAETALDAPQARTGAIDLSPYGDEEYHYDFGALMAALSVPFSPPFTTQPTVTMSLAPPVPGLLSSAANLGAVSTTGFSMIVSLQQPAPTSAAKGTDEVGRYVSMIEVDGAPAAAYLDRTKGAILYRRALDANGAAWGSPVTVATNIGTFPYTVLRLINGKPAIAFKDSVASPGEVRYVAALDIDGTAWSTSSLVASGLAIGEGIGLLEVSGKPAVVYKDGSGPLWYRHALQADGSTWNAPITIDGGSSLFAGGYVSLLMVNGNPAVSYQFYNLGAGTRELRYARAQNTDGSLWNAPVAVDNTHPDTGYGTSLQVVNGVPAISYMEEIDPGSGTSSQAIRFVIAQDANGSLWNTPVDVYRHTAFLELRFNQTSLAVIGGNPAVLFSEKTTLGTLYTRALDSSGNQWGNPVHLDADPNSGEWNSLISLHDRPAVAYSNLTDNSLKYIYAGADLLIQWIALAP